MPEHSPTLRPIHAYLAELATGAIEIRFNRSRAGLSLQQVLLVSRGATRDSV
jgi:hypothetical protein